LTDVSKLSDNDLLFEYKYTGGLSSWNSEEGHLGIEIGNEVRRRGLDFENHQNTQQFKPKTIWIGIVEFITSLFRN
jgi:hypothetical protein